jgi:hypothetical protein
MDLADPNGRCGLVCIGDIALGGVAVVTRVGEVVAGGAIVTEGTLGAVSAISGFVGAGVDTKEGIGGSGVSSSGVTAIGLTSGALGFLGDTAGTPASPNAPNSLTTNGCG